MTAPRPGSRSPQTPLTIGIMGPPLTGKDTFISELAIELRREGYKVAAIEDLNEYAQRLGIPILENHTSTSTMWFITRGISNELEASVHADVVLVDGAVPEALATYFAALQHRGERAGSQSIEKVESLVRSHRANYDLLFRTTLDSVTPIASRTPRDDDQKFRCLTDHWIQLIGAQLNIESVPILPSGHDAGRRFAVSFVKERLL
ncbi:hypothetical protein [Amycolatopsis lexingtonensis]|uniref:hypothetical protein n=1 Tax=Amycolatopsis lexingtonensis TaxID=218822 RepID=UPI003F70C226